MACYVLGAFAAHSRTSSKIMVVRYLRLCDLFEPKIFGCGTHLSEFASCKLVLLILQCRKAGCTLELRADYCILLQDIHTCTLDLAGTLPLHVWTIVRQSCTAEPIRHDGRLWTKPMMTIAVKQYREICASAGEHDERDTSCRHPVAGQLKIILSRAYSQKDEHPEHMHEQGRPPAY